MKSISQTKQHDILSHEFIADLYRNIYSDSVVSESSLASLEAKKLTLEQSLWDEAVVGERVAGDIVTHLSYEGVNSPGSGVLVSEDGDATHLVIDTSSDMSADGGDVSLMECSSEPKGVWLPVFKDNQEF